MGAIQNHLHFTSCCWLHCRAMQKGCSAVLLVVTASSQAALSTTSRWPSVDPEDYFNLEHIQQNKKNNTLNYSCKRGSKKREVAKNSQYVSQELFHTIHTYRQPPSRRGCCCGIPNVSFSLIQISQSFLLLNLIVVSKARPRQEFSENALKANISDL